MDERWEGALLGAAEGFLGTSMKLLEQDIMDEAALARQESLNALNRDHQMSMAPSGFRAADSGRIIPQYEIDT